MQTKNTPLSASRIKTLQTCSMLYKAKYASKIPDKQNEGSLKGSVIHLVLECLGNPRHKKHFNQIVAAQDTFGSLAVKRLVLKHAKRDKIDDFENVDLINKMTLEAINYDFFGDKIGKPTESISEKDFDINVSENGKDFRILGFIDKLFLFKRKKLAIIRDFKSSKSVFTGEDISDNMQNLMYCLAVKYLYPEYIKRKMEFLFLKFPLDGEGLIEMDEIDLDELEGFELFLTQVQRTINNFNDETAVSNLAYNKGYGGEGFTGKVVCGRDSFKGQLKKDGTPFYSCPAKWPFDYFVLLDEENKIIASAHTREELIKKQIPDKISYIEERSWLGCPAWQKKKVDNSDFWL